MAVFPLQFFTQDDAQVRFNEKYQTAPLGRRFAAQPKGAYVGFLPSVLGTVLTLSPDPTHGYSAIKVDSNFDPGGMDVFVTAPVDLDFVGQPDVDFPLNVMLRVAYTADGSSPTTSEVFSRSASIDIAVTEVLLCVVDGPAASLSVVFDASLQQRDEPLAYGHVNYGFMPGGAIEDLQAAADIVNEVIAARECLDGTVHADLATRIAVDYGSTAMANRLALLSRALRSNDYAVGTGEGEVIVSGSFTEIDRLFDPKITLDGNGSETVAGALAADNDTVRNVALVIDATTGYRPVDNDTDRLTIFGRLSGPNETGVAGVWQFLNASKNVSATDSGGAATSEMSVRDSILGPDGNYYEIETISTDNSISLSTAYQASSASSPSTTIRRWQLMFKKLVGGAEVDATLQAATTIRFFFPAFVSMELSNADWKLGLHTAGERKPLQAASTTIPGTVRLAESGALLGSVNIQNVGVSVGAFHTINFSAANASVVPSATIPGEVEVAAIGPQGAAGAPGASGGPGDTGGAGPGFSALSPFEASGEFPNLPTGSTNPWSFTKDMGHNVRYLHGNVAKFRDNVLFGSNADRLDILDVSIVSATEGRIEGTHGGVTGDVFTTVFLSSAGD